MQTRRLFRQSLGMGGLQGGPHQFDLWWLGHFPVRPLPQRSAVKVHISLRILGVLISMLAAQYGQR